MATSTRSGLVQAQRRGKRRRAGDRGGRLGGSERAGGPGAVRPRARHRRALRAARRGDAAESAAAPGAGRLGRRSRPARGRGLLRAGERSGGRSRPTSAAWCSCIGFCCTEAYSAGGPGRALETSSSHSRHRRDRGDCGSRRRRGGVRRAQDHGRLQGRPPTSSRTPSWRRSRGPPTRSTGRAAPSPTTTTQSQAGPQGSDRSEDGTARGLGRQQRLLHAALAGGAQAGLHGDPPGRAATTPRCCSTGQRSRRHRRLTRSGR